MTVGVGAEDITVDDTNDVSVEDVVDDAPAEVSDSEPEDTPDEAPVDVAEEPPEVEENEPEDTPDASPDDDDVIIAPAVLASTDYKADTVYDAGNNIEWYYHKDSDTSGTLTFRIKDGCTSDGKIPMEGYDGIFIDSWYAPWEELITNGTLSLFVDRTGDDLPLTKIVFEEGITYIPMMSFNMLHGNIVIELPNSMDGIQEEAFGGLTDSNRINGIVDYHGTADEWAELKKNIGENNSCLTLNSTTAFLMFIPDVIELSNTKPEYEFTMYQAYNLAVVTNVSFSKSNTNTVSVDCGSKYVGTGSNECILTAVVDGDKCTISADYTDDYQDYSCSDTLTFNFITGYMSTK